MKFIFLFLFVSFSTIACSQAPAERPATVNPDFDQKISKTISFTVPAIGPEELKDMFRPTVIDVREQEEYDVSHIAGARFVSYKQFDLEKIKDVPKGANIVLYCSIGYRSEKIGELLQKAGYTNVHNLYGSIFEWVNQGNPLVDKNGEPTNKVHTYNRNWSKWVEEGKAEKVW